jgi:hypothetical protein
VADETTKTESLADLLREARRDWITDTEWVVDEYGNSVQRPRGEAIRAFGARIDAALQGETPEEADPCVSHVALKEWDRMFGAWVKHQAGLPSDVPLWPNPEWSQDVAMVAHALAQHVTPAADPPPRAESAPD